MSKKKNLPESHRIVTGHRPHMTGSGTHDSRPNRERTRGQSDRAEVLRQGDDLEFVSIVSNGAERDCTDPVEDAQEYDDRLVVNNGHHDVPKEDGMTYAIRDILDDT